MKPFLGIDITENKKNEEMNGKEFIVKEVPQSMLDAHEKRVEESQNSVEKSGLSLPLKIFKYISAVGSVLAVIALGAIISNEEPMKAFQGLWQRAPWAFVLGALFCVLFIVLLTADIVKRKAVIEGDSFKKQLSDLDSCANSMYVYLGVPDNAPETEVIMFPYKEKDMTPVPKTLGMMPTPYVNLSVRLYKDEENLYVSSIDCKYAIPLSSLKRIDEVNKRISVPFWMKDNEPTKEECKKYKLNLDNSGNMSFKPYYILIFEVNGEEWGLYFPCYEREIYRQVTGL